VVKRSDERFDFSAVMTCGLKSCGRHFEDEPSLRKHQRERHALWWKEAIASHVSSGGSAHGHIPLCVYKYKNKGARKKRRGCKNKRSSPSLLLPQSLRPHQNKPIEQRCPHNGPVITTFASGKPIEQLCPYDAPVITTFVSGKPIEFVTFNSQNKLLILNDSALTLKIMFPSVRVGNRCLEAKANRRRRHHRRRRRRRRHPSSTLTRARHFRRRRHKTVAGAVATAATETLFPQQRWQQVQNRRRRRRRRWRFCRFRLLLGGKWVNRFQRSSKKKGEAGFLLEQKTAAISVNEHSDAPPAAAATTELTSTEAPAPATAAAAASSNAGGGTEQSESGSSEAMADDNDEGPGN